MPNWGRKAIGVIATIICLYCLIFLMPLTVSEIWQATSGADLSTYEPHSGTISNTPISANQRMTFLASAGAKILVLVGFGAVALFCFRRKDV
jgi:glycopeptide antibiotics resistance protein